MMSRLSSSFSVRFPVAASVLLVLALAPGWWGVAEEPGTAPGYRIGAGDVLLVFIYEENSREGSSSAPTA
ncbi:MAG: hypothetical protein Q9Q13_08390 [Acidobacteriota bacterium]|nr:hypothetical protein [Acidobacteriota bacterium]